MAESHMEAPIDATTRSLIKQKSKHWKHYVKSKDPKVMASYKKIRNSVRNKTRQADRLIQNEIARARKDNPKHFWKYVKSKTKSKEPIGT